MLRRARSVRQKVMLVVLATTVTALAVTAFAMLLYETRAYRNTLAGDLQAQADIVGRASAPALAFNDPAAAGANLALLRARPQITGAAIRDGTGRTFASFGQAPEPSAGDEGMESLPNGDSFRITGNEILVFHPIVEKAERLGTVVIRARYELASRLRDYIGILVAVLIGSLAVAVLLSAALQRGITQPIVALTDVAHRVMERRDFSLRVQKRSDDEVGYLVDAFNAMLGEVGRRADALEQTNRSLSHEMDERRGAEDALRAADRRKDEFLATLAHELRNPLAPLRNALTILKMPGIDAAVAAQAREMMERQLTQMVRLVDDLLDVSRITTGKLSLRKQPVALDVVLRAAIDTAMPFIEARHHVLGVSLPKEPVMLAADATRLAQVFSNLLHNAAKFTAPGGRIDVKGERDEQRVTIRVIDNGVGIAPEMLVRVFEMFAQADHSLERTQAGLGVGLTLARRLVELHGGTLEATSDGVGRGSQFIVRLPVARTKAARSTPDAEAPATASLGVGRRVLVVDDNEDFANSLALILRAMDNDVRVAHDGAAGLEVARQWQPQIGFLDIGLPKINGYELARRLRQDAATSRMALVAITGWGQEKDRQLAVEAGFDRHLVKPVEPAQVLDLLGSLGPRG